MCILDGYIQGGLTELIESFCLHDEILWYLDGAQRVKEHKTAATVYSAKQILMV